MTERWHTVIRWSHVTTGESGVVEDSIEVPHDTILELMRGGVRFKLNGCIAPPRAASACRHRGADHRVRRRVVSHLTQEPGDRMPTIEPYSNNIVVEEFQLGEVSRGGLLIPQIAKASVPYRYAKVISVGPGRYAPDGTLIPCSSKPDDIVAFAKNAGYEFPLDDEQGNEQVFRMINEQYVMGRMHGMPEQSLLTGLDGQLLRMNPSSRAPSDNAVENLERIEKATKQGFIDTAGNTLATMNALDEQEEHS